MRFARTDAYEEWSAAGSVMIDRLQANGILSALRTRLNHIEPNLPL